MKKNFLSGYSVFLFFFVIFSFIFIDPNLQYLHTIYSGAASQKKVLASIVFIVFLSMWYCFFFYLLKKLSEGKIKGKLIKKLIFVSVCILVFAYPAMLSYDIFNYMLSAKVMYYYHENPYIIMPIEFQNEPYLSFTRAANKTALYGPSWILLSSIPFLFGMNHFLLTLFNFKILVSACYLGLIYLIFKLSKNIISVALFALNPLVIIETLVSGHNDIVMMFFAVASVLLLFQKKYLLSILFLILSIAIKYATIFLLPLYLYYFFKLLRNQSVSLERFLLYCSYAMLMVFFLSPLREELYPWYAIWFLTFVSMLPEYTLLTSVSITLSIGLELRYIPYMLLGTYASPTPQIKLLITVIAIFSGIVVLLKKRHGIWKNSLSQ